MNKIILIVALIFTATLSAAPKLDSYDVTGRMGGVSYEQDYSNNMSIWAYYKFGKEVFKEAQEFEMYVAIGETTDDKDFTLVDKRTLKDYGPADIRLWYAIQRVYFSLNELDLDNIDDYIENRKLSVYSIVRNSAGEETRTEFRVLTIDLPCCWIEEEDLSLPTFNKEQGVSFTLKANHVDPDQVITYDIEESSNLTYPEGIEVNSTTGEFTWNNPTKGEFGFVIQLEDLNNWIYEQEVTFEVDAFQSVKANELGLRIFPNPTTEVVTIDLQSIETSELNVYDINGNLILNQTVNSNQAKVNLANQSAGKYIIKVNDIIYTVIKK
jgi:hypothetical protein